MEIDIEKLEQLKYFIIENFNKQPRNFQMEIKREFQRQDSAAIMQEMNKTISILSSKFFTELKFKNPQMFEGIANPENIIEEVLFEYVNS